MVGMAGRKINAAIPLSVPIEFSPQCSLDNTPSGGGMVQIAALVSGTMRLDHARIKLNNDQARAALTNRLTAKFVVRPLAISFVCEPSPCLRHCKASRARASGSLVLIRRQQTGSGFYAIPFGIHFPPDMSKDTPLVDVNRGYVVPGTHKG